MARVVLVTGASAGIGQACADRLHGGGWTVVGASRRGTSSGGWSAAVMDVDRNGAVEEGVAAVLADHGRLDAVVAAAGWGLAGPVETTPMEDAKAQFETNFWGAVRVVRAALPAMRRQGGGRVVLVSSIGGVVGIPFQAFYSASKFALEGYAEALAYEVAPFGVDVTLVEPGNVRTEFTASRRLVAAPAGDDPYAASTARALGVMVRDEERGVPAADVARVVERVLAARRPPRRVSAGKAGERVGVVAKRLIPFRIFERAARGSLGVG
jgi:NAD(P)-dependent dehydrogenase (short-subunit alcohol dehydrogenase family)